MTAFAARGGGLATLRADQIGSMLRPQWLLEARHARAQGQISAEELRSKEDEAILLALELQRDVGLEIFSDGEYRRGWFAGGLLPAVEGLVHDEHSSIDHERLWTGPGAEEAVATAQALQLGHWHAAERVRRVRSVAADEASFLRARAPGPFKITLTGPMHYASEWFRAGAAEAYPSRLELLEDIAAILASEVEELVAEGVDYVQLDSLRYVGPDVRGEGGDALLEAMLRADNAVLAPARAAGVTTALHMCRGNNRSAHGRDRAPYDEVAARAFAALEVDRLLLEYDSERAGGFEPLEAVPPSTTVVLGLISTKLPTLESPEDLKRRIEEAARVVPAERLALSPQCGFASTAPGNLLSWEDQRRKLELVVETAQAVWG